MSYIGNCVRLSLRLIEKRIRTAGIAAAAGGIHYTLQRGGRALENSALRILPIREGHAQRGRRQIVHRFCGVTFARTIMRLTRLRIVAVENRTDAPQQDCFTHANKLQVSPSA